MSFLVATNVVPSHPPERRLTGTPHARAKSYTLHPPDQTSIEMASSPSQPNLVIHYFVARKPLAYR